MNRDVMRRPPRSKSAPILTRRLLARVGFSASLIIIGVLFILARELSDGRTTARDQTMVSFLARTRNRQSLTHMHHVDVLVICLPRPGIGCTGSRTQRSFVPRPDKQDAAVDSVGLFLRSTHSHLLPASSIRVSHRVLVDARSVRSAHARRIELHGS